MRAGLLLLLAVVLSAAAAAPARAGLVTRPHAKKPLSDKRAATRSGSSRSGGRSTAPSRCASSSAAMPRSTPTTTAASCTPHNDGKQRWLNTVSGDERSGDERFARGRGNTAAATCGPRSARGSRGGGGTLRPAGTCARSSGGWRPAPGGRGTSARA